MRITSQSTVERSGHAGDWISRTTSRKSLFTGILGLALLLVTLHGAESATLAWDASSSPGVAGYRVYYGPTSGNYSSSIVAGNATTNMVTGLALGVVHFFAVKAYDANGLESIFSNEVSFTPGHPTIQISVTAAGAVVLTLNGPFGRLYDIQATPDFSAWSVLGSVTLDANGSASFVDTTAASFPRRYYRSQQKP